MIGGRFSPSMPLVRLVCRLLVRDLSSCFGFAVQCSAILMELFCFCLRDPADSSLAWVQKRGKLSWRRRGVVEPPKVPDKIIGSHNQLDDY